MRILIKELEVGPLRLSGEVLPEALKLDPNEVILQQPVKVTVTAEKHPLGIRVQGSYSAVGHVFCARCLEPYQVEAGQDFDLFYQPHAAGRPITGEIELKEKDTEVSFFWGDGIEVGDILREQILLSLPMKPICREDCQGLCPHCGKNRNLETCDCESVLLDPRLEPLLKIKNRINL
jgi:uncharacterized protein